MTKTILVTGSSGQLGKTFLTIYKDLYQIYSFPRSSLDISNKDEVKKILDLNPDIIVNCAAMTDVDSCEINEQKAFEINAHSILNFSKYRGHFFQISTDYIFDGRNGPYYENDPVNPLNIYGESKLKGENIVKDIFKRYTILRSNIIFGNHSRASFLRWVVESLKSNQKIKVVDDQFNNPVSVIDCSNVISFLINEEKYGTYHLGSDLICSRFEFANLIANYWDLDCSLISKISTEELSRNLKSYRARRPLKSGLVSNYDFMPKLSLKGSIEALKESS